MAIIIFTILSIIPNQIFQGEEYMKRILYSFIGSRRPETIFKNKIATFKCLLRVLLGQVSVKIVTDVYEHIKMVKKILRKLFFALVNFA